MLAKISIFGIDSERKMAEMKKLIESFTDQIQEGLNIYHQNPPQNLRKDYKNVVISGLGGSGIGGTITSGIAEVHAKIPVVVNKTYGIPAFVSQDTLFIACSYSGNTEETLSAVKLALEKGAEIICVTSGGSLKQIATENDLHCLVIPGGNPPRACLGYSLTALICILSSMSLLPPSTIEELKNAAISLKSQTDEIQTQAKEIATKIVNKQVVIYCEASNEGVAIRLRQQLNENSKTLAWHHVVPEMNHNELVGWTLPSENHAVIIIRTSEDHFRNQKRIEINKEIIGKLKPIIIEIWGKGETSIEKILSLIHLEDWISYYLAEIRGVDIMDIKVIDYLKSELAKFDVE